MKALKMSVLITKILWVVFGMILVDMVAVRIIMETFVMQKEKQLGKKKILGKMLMISKNKCQSDHTKILFFIKKNDNLYCLLFVQQKTTTL